MATYEMLTHYLAGRRENELILSLDKIEEIIGSPLPVTARKRPQYWANVVKDEQRSPPNRAARKAGYQAFLIPSLQQVRFLKSQN
ncbi:hypothetical protein [Rhizobium sp. EC-SD404]|uniref:DUF7662 domain-containing protein n=1 Tax=Rhizobium sp. EC-SD404 TaxID=2038389 RepID=UPI001252F258|nr:hypothetical protein [Rhizobium sp. EC-SD404]VVT04771.1 conserved hypothetical protein [Rhizobium sp. EC-SD404]